MVSWGALGKLRELGKLERQRNGETRRYFQTTNDKQQTTKNKQQM